jgi:hypothetical protein
MARKSARWLRLAKLPTKPVALSAPKYKGELAPIQNCSTASSISKAPTTSSTTRHFSTSERGRNSAASKVASAGMPESRAVSVASGFRLSGRSCGALPPAAARASKYKPRPARLAQLPADSGTSCKKPSHKGLLATNSSSSALHSGMTARRVSRRSAGLPAEPNRRSKLTEPSSTASSKALSRSKPTSAICRLPPRKMGASPSRAHAKKNTNQ